MTLLLPFVMAVSAKHGMCISWTSTGKTKCSSESIGKAKVDGKGPKGQRGTRQVTSADGELGAEDAADGCSAKKPFPQVRRQRPPGLQ